MLLRLNKVVCRHLIRTEIIHCCNDLISIQGTYLLLVLQGRALTVFETGCLFGTGCLSLF